MTLIVVVLGCLLFFCAPHQHAAKRHAPACEKIALAYAAKTGSRDDFVKSFPAAKQRHVLECIGDE